MIAVDKVGGMGLALYRRYRPDTFDSVIGQNQVTVPLARALDSGKLTHAYLFSGPRGCGKTSCARILARCINCEKGPTSHPCGECESCKDLATGGPGSIDVVEIDAASHNGVDDARELRERAGFAPARDRYKIFILDEAHMVTQQGFNALLKIVEEPPEHVIFIFATTEPEKVIGTIRSRTHHYPFRLVPPEIMEPYLEQVCHKEHVKAAPGVLRLAMRAGGGSVRDTMSVLDQLMVGAEHGEISHEAATALLGFTPDALISQCIDAIAQQDGETLYGVIEKVVVGGFDPKRFIEDVLSRVRDLLVVTVGGSRAQAVLDSDGDTENFSQLQRQSESLGLHALNDIADAINTTLATMTGAISPRMRLELLAARILAMRADELHPQTKAQAIAASVASQRNESAQSAQKAHVHRETGFIGSQHHRAAPAMPPVASTPALPTHEDMKAAHTDATELQATSAVRDSEHEAAPTRHDGEGVGEHAAGVHSDMSTDQRWDALVQVLPPDVREYVSRDRVPQVELKDGNNGRKHLVMTFDVPLSQHAFALAVSQESVHGQTSVPKIVMHAVHEAFDAQTMIFPSGIAANGDKVASTKRMSPEQVANVKRQIALQKAGLSASNLGSAIQPVVRNHHDGASRDHQSGTSEGQDETPSGAHHPKRSKHVVLPDLDDGYDPWDPANAAQTMRKDNIGDEPTASDDATQTVHAHSETHVQIQPHPNLPTAQQKSKVDSANRVDPTLDTYSMDDPSLHEDESLKMDDIKQLFNVKKVEEFAADDPKNPRNIQRRSSQQHSQGND